jgi:hypothetical protein
MHEQRFPWNESENSNVEIGLFESNLLIGSVHLSVKDLKRNKLERGWHVLNDTTNIPIQTEIYVEIILISATMDEMQNDSDDVITHITQPEDLKEETLAIQPIDNATSNNTVTDDLLQSAQIQQLETENTILNEQSNNSNTHYLYRPDEEIGTIDKKDLHSRQSSAELTSNYTTDNEEGIHIWRMDKSLQEDENSIKESSNLDPLITEIASIREKITLIESKLSDSKSPNQMQSLMDTKLQLLDELSNLLETLHEMDQPGNSSEIISLDRVTITVSDATGELNKRLRGKQVDVFKRVVFIVEIKRPGGDGWLMTKTLYDFCKMNQKMCNESRKFKSMKFPDVPRSIAHASKSGESTRLGLAVELERWLNIIISDSVLSHCGPIQSFLRPSNSQLHKGSHEPIQKTESVSVDGAKDRFKMNLSFPSFTKTLPALFNISQNPQARLRQSSEKLTVETRSTIDEKDNQVPQLEPENTNTGINTKTALQKPKVVLSRKEIDIILESLFSTMEELFNLNNPDQWIRQRGFYAMKNILHKTFASSIGDSLQSKLYKLTNEESTVFYMTQVNESLWPNGSPYNSQSGTSKPSEDEKMNARLEAKKMVLECNFFGLDGLRTIIGTSNTEKGILGLFNMIQCKEVNESIICQLLESYAALIFKD